MLAAASLALAAPSAQDPVALVERSLAGASVTFAGASATASAYSVSWPASSSLLALIFSNEARSASEADRVRSFTVSAPLDAANRLPSASRDALLRVSDALNRACFSHAPRSLGTVVDAALANRLARLSVRRETRVSVEDGEGGGRVLRLTFVLPSGGMPSCAMHVPRR
ncbi:hypothetical protein DES52_11084 [Deinococcus yavapaiensis KR-236]|uniref:Uncharacterized protein n=2 Tax=Deinococcus TaxID=1298 RepID=A0A318S5W5_9DEIO|nr:hypothetical protein DES52_11084 [Deinococcus yavapaiensis KR-236]